MVPARRPTSSIVRSAPINVDEIAALYRAGRHLGDVDDDQVHRDAPGEGAVQPGNDGGAGGDLRVALRVGGARGARVAVGIADRHHREPPRPVRGPLRVVADRVAVGRGPDLDDAALKPDHRLHRVAAAGSRIAAVEGVAGADEIVMWSFRQEDPRRVAERGAHFGERLAHRRKAIDLARVQPVFRLLGADEMAHHQGRLEIGKERAARDLGGRGSRQPEAVHAGVEMERRRIPRPGVPAKSRPFGDLVL